MTESSPATGGQPGEAASILGANIRRLRLQAKVSQEDVAALSGMHVTNFGKIEPGSANPSLSTVLHIATVLDRTVSALCEGIMADHAPGTDITVVDLNEARKRSRQRTG